MTAFLAYRNDRRRFPNYGSTLRPRRTIVRHPFGFLILILAMPRCVLAADSPAPPPAATPTLSTPVALADRVLAETGTAYEAARRWLRENLSNEAVNGYARSAESSVVEKFNAALEEARLAHEATLGLFVYTPGATEPWTRVTADSSLPARIVLLVHGWDNAAPASEREGYTFARFNYPNDQPIRASADRLVESLRELNERGVSTVDIVGHSMGGLVARDALTRPEHYKGNARGGDGLPAVQRFIMLATPNQGSPLACLRGVMEVRDQFVRWTQSENKFSSGLLGCMVDGCGEAGDDLAPGSPFLAELNSRSLPTHLRITIVTGAVASTTRERIAGAFDNPYVRRVLGAERCDQWKCGAEAAGSGVGDGVVPGSSTMLDGVSDVVSVRADHRSMIRVIEPLEATRNALGMENPTPPAIPIIIDRLSRAAPQ
jgi:pimeloyl-ACP methyl ester carboxylesterase